MTAERPYIASIGGRFHLVWAEAHDAPYTRDRSITPQVVYTWVERACVAAYGIVPDGYGIGF